MNKNLLLVVIFIMFLTLPNISYWFLKDKMDNNNYQNRELYKKPEFTFSDILSFPRNYDNYFTDHLAYGNEIRKIRSDILYKAFHLGSTSSVIVGEDGWLFYNGTGDGNPILDYRNIEIYTNEEKEMFKNSLLNTRNKLNNKDINFYLLVIPNKENVYSYKLKKIIKKSNRKYSKTEDLINYLRENTDLNIIYPKDELMSATTEVETYYKYDTHWNNYGAFLGVMKLIKDFDNEFEIPDIKVTYEYSSGDLATMNLLPNLSNEEPNVKNFYDDITYSCESSTNLKICNSDNAIYDKTILFVGDSFRNATVQYLAKIYKRAVIIHKNEVKEDLISKYDVDTVVYESVERYSNDLLNTNILVNDY